MKLFKLTRTDEVNYGEFVACVVVAEDEAKARLIHPSGSNAWWGVGCFTWNGSQWAKPVDRAWNGTSWEPGETIDTTWADPATLRVEEIGAASDDTGPAVVLADYNAG